MDEIQTRALMGALSGNGEQADMEQQMMRMQSLLEEMTQVAAEQLLRPGDSELALQMLVDDQGSGSSPWTARPVTWGSRVATCPPWN